MLCAFAVSQSTHSSLQSRPPGLPFARTLNSPPPRISPPLLRVLSLGQPSTLRLKLRWTDLRLDRSFTLRAAELSERFDAAAPQGDDRITCAACHLAITFWFLEPLSLLGKRHFLQQLPPWSAAVCRRAGCSSIALPHRVRPGSMFVLLHHPRPPRFPVTIYLPCHSLLHPPSGAYQIALMPSAATTLASNQGGTISGSRHRSAVLYRERQLWPDQEAKRWWRDP